MFRVTPATVANLKAGDEVLVNGYLVKYTDKSGTVKYEVDIYNNVMLTVLKINGEDTGEVAGTLITTGSDTLVALKNAAVTTADAAKEYKLVMYHKTNDKLYYASGVMSGTFLGATTYGADSATVKAEMTKGGFYLALTAKGATAKKYITITETSSSKATISLTDTATTIFSFKYTNVLFAAGTQNTNGWKIGSYDTFETISAGTMYYIDQDPSSKIDNSDYVCRLVETTANIPGISDAEPTLPDSAEGGKNNPYNVAKAIQVAGALADGVYSTSQVYVTGYVVSATENTQYHNWEIYIADTVGGDTTFLCYRVVLSGDVTSFAVNDKVVIRGYLQNYKENDTAANVPQLTYKGSANPTIISREVGNGTIKASASNDTTKVTITITGATEGVLTGTNGTEVEFTVAVTGCEITDVKVNGVVVTETAGKYKVTLAGNMEIVVTTHETGEALPGTEERPYTAAEAAAEASKLAEDVYSNMVYVTGYVVSSTYDSTRSNWQINIADEVGSATTFLCYGIKLSGGITSFAVNDQITIQGYLKNQYGKTPEISYKGQEDALIIKRVIGDATIKAATTNAHSTITFTPAADGTTGIVSGKNGDTVTFTISVETGYELVDVLVAGNTISANNNVYSVVLTGDMAVVVNVKEVGAADPVVLYTVATTSAKAAKNTNNYTSSTTVTDNGLTLNVTNFNTGSTWDHIRCGNSKAAGNASIATSEAIKGTVTSIVINISAVTGINELYLEISDDSTFATSTKVPCANPVAGNNQFTITEPAANKYYRIVFDMSKTSSNGVVHLTQVVFNGYPAE